MSMVIHYNEAEQVVYINGRKFVPETLQSSLACSFCKKEVSGSASIIYLPKGVAHTECTLDAALLIQTPNY